MRYAARCDRTHTHAKVEHIDTVATGLYPVALCKLVAKTVMQGKRADYREVTARCAFLSSADACCPIDAEDPFDGVHERPSMEEPPALRPRLDVGETTDDEPLFEDVSLNAPP